MQVRFVVVCCMCSCSVVQSLVEGVCRERCCKSLVEGGLCVQCGPLVEGDVCTIAKSLVEGTCVVKLPSPH